MSRDETRRSCAPAASSQLQMRSGGEREWAAGARVRWTDSYSSSLTFHGPTHWPTVHSGSTSKYLTNLSTIELEFSSHQLNYTEENRAQLRFDQRTSDCGIICNNYTVLNI